MSLLCLSVLILLVSHQISIIAAINTSFPLSTLSGYNVSNTAGGVMSGIYNNTLYAVLAKTSITLDLSHINSNTLITNKSITFTNNPVWELKLLGTDGGWNSISLAAYSMTTIMNLIYYLFPNDDTPSTILIFDMDSNNWTHKSPQIFPNNTVYQIATHGCQIQQNPYIYVIGGKYPKKTNQYTEPTNQFLRFDTENCIITILQNMSTSRSAPSCFLYDDQLYAMGGLGDSGPTNVIEVYNITNDTWSDYGATLNNKRYLSFSFVHPNNKWIITIGGKCNGLTNNICPSEYFEPNTGIIIQDDNKKYNANCFGNVIWKYSDYLTIVFLYGGRTSQNSHERHDVKYMVLSVDDYIEGLQSTNNPSISPSINPTTMSPTQHPITIIDYEVIGLFARFEWNVSNITQSLYNLVIINTTKFNQLMKKNILNHYGIDYDDINDDVILMLMDLYHNETSSNWMNITYNITNYNKQIGNMLNYLNSNQFGNSLTININKEYYHNSSINAVISTTTTAKQYKSFLPPPFDAHLLLTLKNPVSISCLCFVFVLCIILLMGYIHGQKPLKMNKIFKFGITDSFKLTRVISFLLNTIMFMTTMNTIYGYIYFYTYYNYHVQLLIIGILCLLIVIIKISLNLHYFMYWFQGDLIAVDTDYAVQKWVKKNLRYLYMLSIISCSLYASISFANCHLFGLQWFEMGLSDVQMEKFKRIHNRKLLCLSVVNICIYFYAIYYLFMINYDGTGTIKQFTILCILCTVIKLLSNLSTITKDNSLYGTKRFEIRIECHGNDIEKIKERKGLTKNIIKNTAEYLELSASQLEIVNITNKNNGILLRFMYNNIIDSNGNSANKVTIVNKNTDDSFMERLLTSTDDINSIVVLLEQLETDDGYRLNIQNCYELENIPLNVSCNLIHDYHLSDLNNVQNRSRVDFSDDKPRKLHKMTI